MVLTCFNPSQTCAGPFQPIIPGMVPKIKLGTFEPPNWSKASYIVSIIFSKHEATESTMFVHPLCTAKKGLAHQTENTGTAFDSWEVDQIEAEDGKYPDTHLLETSWLMTNPSMRSNTPANLKHPAKDYNSSYSYHREWLCLFLTQRVSLPKKSLNFFWLGSRANLGYRKGGSFAREPNDKKN